MLRLPVVPEEFHGAFLYLFGGKFEHEKNRSFKPSVFLYFKKLLAHLRKILMKIRDGFYAFIKIFEVEFFIRTM